VPTFVSALTLQSPLVLLLGLAALTIFHEDIAIAAGAGIVTAGSMAPVSVALALVAGIIGGDMLIYGLGRLADDIPWIRRRTDSPLFRRCRETLERNLLSALLVCRVVPGLLFPTYLACGLTRVRFGRFAMITATTATLHVGILLISLTTLFAAQAVDLRWAGIALVLVLVLARTPVVGTAAASFWRTAASRKERRTGMGVGVEAGVEVVRLPGMPEIRLSRTVALAERIPTLPFYVPLAVQWLYLGWRHGCVTLPTIANPMIEAGGLLGESKISCLDQVGDGARRWVASSAMIVNDGSWTAARLEAFAADHGIGFPMVAKPDIGWRGFGVRLVDEAADLLRYLDHLPADCAAILQTYVPSAGEAGVFYVRRPGETSGFIFSMTFRYFPHVVGDGRSSLGDLIDRTPRAAWKGRLHREALADRLGEVPAAGELVRLALVGSNRVGGLYIDARPYVTDALTRRFDEIAASMPNFHFGRFDIRFDTLERLQAGEGFHIVEVNGAGAEAIHVWDPSLPLATVYRDLFEQQRLMFEIAAANRSRGFRPLSLMELIGYQRRQQRLLSTYPPSN